MGYSLVYTLLRTRLAGRAGYSWSISVTIDGKYGRETATASDLTRSRTEAVRLFDLLADLTVTPCALADMLEELL